MSLIIFLSICFVIWLAYPVIHQTKRQVSKDGVDIEIVFDVSYSMIAEDIFPSRIEAAKKVFSDFIDWLSSDRVGLILFAGKPFQSVPLSYDYDFLTDFIESMGVETIDQWNTNLQGTALWDALVLWVWVLMKEENEREKIIILITDGEANRGINPEIALKLLKEKNIKAYTIGVGKDEQTTITTTLPGWFIQKTPVGGLDEVTLQKIAQVSGGKYFRADSPETLEKILSTIAQLEKKEDTYTEYAFYSPVLHILILIMIFPYLLLLYVIFFKKIRL